jgi:effector-binding domain-containing protein
MSTTTGAPTIESRPPRPFIAISARITSNAELRQAADQGFPRLFGWLHERGLAPAGPPFIRYREFSATGSPVRVAVAVPTAERVQGSDGIEASMLPAGEWVTFLHRGPYSHASEPDLAAAHATVRAWIDGQHDLELAREEALGDETALSGCIEQFQVGPVEQSDFRQWETELAYLVERSPK